MVGESNTKLVALLLLADSNDMERSVANNNLFMTDDNLLRVDTAMAKAFDFSHQGAAGSTELAFYKQSTTSLDAANSHASAISGDGMVGSGSGEGSGQSLQSGGSMGSGAGSNGSTGSSGSVDSSGSQGGGTDNAFLTNDHAVQFLSQTSKAFDFSHQGAAGSVNLTGYTAHSTAYEAANSHTSALFGDGVFGGHGALQDGSHSLLGL